MSIPRPTRELPYLNRFGRPFYRVDENGCWVWLRSFSHAYGKYRNESAHRYFYKQAKGPIPDGYQVDHLCKNPPCVNPDHLEAVNATENVRRSSATKLTLRVVNVIRHRHLTYPGHYNHTARELGVSSSLIEMICRNQKWKDPEYQKNLEAVYGTDPRRARGRIRAL